MGARPRVAFFVEAHLGHRTLLETLRSHARHSDLIEPLWFPLTRGSGGLARRAGAANWSVEAGLRVRHALARLDSAPDAVFLHTQTLAALAAGPVGRLPSVVSTDGTPVNADAVAEGYAHGVGAPGAEALKRRIVSRAFRAADQVVAWTDTARASVVDDYGVPRERTTVINPGVDVGALAPVGYDVEGPTRVLFVGGDFERKGGPLLIEALERQEEPWLLDVVSGGQVPETDRVRVHRGLSPNSAELLALFRDAHVFALPTRADLAPMVIVEAMAAGLPVISTAVGAIPELVTESTGLLIEPGDTAALEGALGRLLGDPAERARLGRAARERAERDFDAERNSARLFELLAGLAGRS